MSVQEIETTANGEGVIETPAQRQLRKAQDKVKQEEREQAEREKIAKAALAEMPALAKDINSTLDRVRVALGRADDLRLTAGQKLLEARTKLNAARAAAKAANVPCQTWADWVAANFQRDLRDVRKLLAIAAAPDPHAALEDARAKNREEVRRSRAKRAVVSPRVSP